MRMTNLYDNGKFGRHELHKNTVTIGIFNDIIHRIADWKWTATARNSNRSADKQSKTLSLLIND